MSTVIFTKGYEKLYHTSGTELSLETNIQKLLKELKQAPDTVEFISGKDLKVGDTVLIAAFGLPKGVDVFTREVPYVVKITEKTYSDFPEFSLTGKLIAIRKTNRHELYLRREDMPEEFYKKGVHLGDNSLLRMKKVRLPDYTNKHAFLKFSSK